MERTGLSLSFNYIVIALIGVTVAFAVVSAFSSNFSVFDEFVGGSISDSKMQLAEQHCTREFRDLCKQQDIYDRDSTQWAEDATFQGRACSFYIEQGALGGEVKPCSGSYER